jgi:hypothetical protein
LALDKADNSLEVSLSNQMKISWPHLAIPTNWLVKPDWEYKV